jgi:hypothetical protein
MNLLKMRSDRNRNVFQFCEITASTPVLSIFLSIIVPHCQRLILTVNGRDANGYAVIKECI